MSKIHRENKTHQQKHFSVAKWRREIESGKERPGYKGDKPAYYKDRKHRDSK